jgi:hypothetical protein
MDQCPEFRDFKRDSRAGFHAGCAGVLILLITSCGTPAPAFRISGTLSEGLAYELEIALTATADLRDCRFSDNITGLEVPRRRMVRETPVFLGGTHQASWDFENGPDDACLWQPVAVSICLPVRTSGAQSSYCNPLFIHVAQDTPNGAGIEIFCSPESGICTSDQGGLIRRYFDLRQPLDIEVDIEAR